MGPAWAIDPRIDSPLPCFAESGPMEDGETGVRRGRWLAVVAASLGWMFDGFEMGLHPLVAHPALRELLGPSVAARFSQGADPAAVAAELAAAVGWWNAVLNALFLFGAATGGVLFGW